MYKSIARNKLKRRIEHCVVHHVYFYNLFIKSLRITFVLTIVMLSRNNAKFVAENKAGTDLNILPNYKSSIVERFYSILFYFLNKKKIQLCLQLFTCFSVFLATIYTIVWRVKFEIRRRFKSKIILGMCDSSHKTLHWILDAFPTVVKAKKSGFLAIATRDSPHFRFNGVDTRHPEPLFCKRPRWYCTLALYIVSIVRSLEQDMRHTF